MMAPRTADSICVVQLIHTHTRGAINLVTFQSQDARVLRVRAEKLEEWWRNDTKGAARHDIDGRKLAEKEGGPSAIDNLFQQTCQEMEAAEAKTTEDGSSEMEQQ
ncbi:uncharacterized protein FPRO_12198 [Fusarium proliferatum ET1]|uniref:Uncharacterized protein n=1 Tax=Fusarium proliferatum (strain ET1) TaxID=1227346 RepID=A0A1L7W271_FUSPR|nr:uncharacterized protein FPRO_12198 [Fusarium proliferatum ET1]CZR46747.1 uncharacterized protein FPRO_12198 [Fusarium proliferatum ET1]